MTTDPEKLGKEEGYRKETLISLGKKNKMDSVGGPGEGEMMGAR